MNEMTAQPQAENSDTILAVQGLKKYFPVRRGFFQRVIGYIQAVDGVGFTLKKGTTLGLVGESGCGKSTVGRLVLRLLDPDGGYVRFKGRDITRLNRRAMLSLRREMQIVFQDPFGSLNPRMNVGQTIGEGLRILGIKDRGARHDRVGKLLDMVGIPRTAADRYPHEFSGGQRQRIGLARALSVDPSLIICDEPVSALDVSIQAQIINLLKSLQESLGLSYLFIAHDLDVVGYLSDQIAVMYLGQIMEIAPAEVLFENPRHPYTWALLSAMPSLGTKKDDQQDMIKGEVPSAFNPPAGCKFQTRCPLVEDRCREGEIRFSMIGPGHAVRCWKAV